ncbi:MAG: PEPxxWA-CTERM sorting domain-containing protein [Qipengyuania sp.]|nr:PEPxxWA-CTERM sorting domain-containing protein [Qipengyuania sp.]
MDSVGALGEDRPFTLGFDFSLSGTKTLNALGYTTVGFTANQSVGLWDSLGNLLISTTVTPGDLQQGFFRWANVSPLVLGPGTYTLGGTYSGGTFASYANNVVYQSGYTWLSDRQTFGGGLNQPTGTFGGYGTQGIPQVNLSFDGAVVPEPATWALLILGFGLTGAAMRSTRRSVRVGFA